MALSFAIPVLAQTPAPTAPLRRSPPAHPRLRRVHRPARPPATSTAPARPPPGHRRRRARPPRVLRLERCRRRPPSRQRHAACRGGSACWLPPGPSLRRRWIPRRSRKRLRTTSTASWSQAARKLYAFIESTPPTDENFAWAQYFLARCLIDLNLRHAGAVYLAKVAHERSNPQVLPKTLEALQGALTLVPHDEVLVDEQIFGSLDLGFLPDSVSDYANYQQGLVDLRVGNERWANDPLRRSWTEGGARPAGPSSPCW